MAKASNSREDRAWETRLNGPESKDSRPLCARDRDRVLYCSAFRRLQGVTQVVAADEGTVFHNRLLHSLKVAQIARRIAERLSSMPESHDLPQGGIDIEAAEAAGLAHDIGHPPFGHVAEEELDSLLRDKLPDGFEGNAQGFRILTKLAVRVPEHLGLNLTCRTLNATIKYPWCRNIAELKPNRSDWPKETRKWGAYGCEKGLLEEVRARSGVSGKELTIEASIMDAADDIAFSVHDAEDFFRAGLIPLEILASPVTGCAGEAHDELNRFLESACERLEVTDETERESHRLAFVAAMDTAPAWRKYVGSQEQRTALRSWTSALIGKFVESATLSEGRCSLPTDLRRQVDMLKQLTWVYVIDAPNLATQQEGYRRVIRDLFGLYLNAIDDKKWHVLPPRFGDQMESDPDALFEGESVVQRTMRLASDIVAGFGDMEALSMHRRLMGISSGRINDILV